MNVVARLEEIAESNVHPSCAPYLEYRTVDKSFRIDGCVSLAQLEALIRLHKEINA